MRNKANQFFSRHELFKRFDLAKSVGMGVFCLTLIGTGIISAQAQDKIFPLGTVVDVTQAPYNVITDDGNDDTANIQRAINDNIDQNRTLYFPSGTYNLSDTLKWQKADGSWSANLTLQGQNRSNTIFRLSDGAAGFGSAANPKPVIVTASFSAQSDGANNQAFHNLIFDLTIHTGSGNAGAIGIDFQGSNQGAIKNVNVVSGDGQGKAGISSTRFGNGPFLMKNISVTGFDYGIDTTASSVYENINVQNQNQAGFRVTGPKYISIRKLASSNYKPALVGDSSAASERPMVTLVDATLTGGSSANYAIDVNGNMLARNVLTSGYNTNALRCHGNVVAGPNYVEYVSATPLDLWTTPRRTLNLPIKETPEYWNSDLDDWAVVGPRLAGEPDDTAAIQRAIDSGKSVVCLKGGYYWIAGTIHVRGAVRQILGMGSQLENYGLYFNDAANPHPVFRIETTNPVSIERLHTGNFPVGGIGIDNASSSTLVLKNFFFRVATTAYNNSVTGGTAFLEDVSCEPHQHNVWQFNNQTVWARQFNPEAYDNANVPTVAQVTNNGSTVWMLGLKTEGVGPITRTTNNGQTEVLGGFHIWSAGSSPGVTSSMKLHIVDSGSASFTYVDDDYFSSQQYVNQIEETRAGSTRLLPTSSVYYRDNGNTVASGPNPGNNVHVVPLYCAFGTATAGTGTGTGLTAQYFDNADLTNAKVTRIDAPTGGFSFNWGTGTPANAGLTSGDTFSVRWQGYIQPTNTIRHTLTVTCDDGIRLWVNGARLIDHWTGGGTFSATIDLNAGQKYPIVIEYNEQTASASCSLKWSWTGQSSVLVPIAQLYPLDKSGGGIVPGLYKIIGVQSGKVLDVESRSLSNNAYVQQWTYGGAPNQKWWVDVTSNGNYKLTAKHSGKTLSVYGASVSNGARIAQTTYQSQSYQQWQLQSLGNGYYEVLNLNSGKGLDVAGAVSTDGAPIQQWSYVGGLNQQWIFEPVTDEDTTYVPPASTPTAQKQTNPSFKSF